MEFDLREAVAEIDRGEVFQIANEARPGENYLFEAILPEEERNSYDAESGNMTIRTTMAGLVGMDSVYPEGGVVQGSNFKERTAKVAQRSRLTEEMLRELQEMLWRLTARGVNTVDEITDTALNFYNKVIIQSLLDTAEWLRGQALLTGKIDWTFNGKRLLVDYGFPSDHILPMRVGNDGYGAPGSKFWDDMKLCKRQQGGQVAVRMMHSDTKEMIIANDANQIKLISENDDTGAFSIVRYKVVGGQLTESTDTRDRATFYTYDDEGEILDLANPGKTKKIPFFPRGAILTLGKFQGNRFRVGSGSTAPPSPIQLGFTQLAPTTEGSGNPGRWGEVYTPQDAPWTIEARGASNILPVIEAEDRVSVASTEMI